MNKKKGRRFKIMSIANHHKPTTRLKAERKAATTRMDFAPFLKSTRF